MFQHVASFSAARSLPRYFRGMIVMDLQAQKEPSLLQTFVEHPGFDSDWASETPFQRLDFADRPNDRNFQFNFKDKMIRHDLFVFPGWEFNCLTHKNVDCML